MGWSPKLLPKLHSKALLPKLKAVQDRRMSSYLSMFIEALREAFDPDYKDWKLSSAKPLLNRDEKVRFKAPEKPVEAPKVDQDAMEAESFRDDPSAFWLDPFRWDRTPLIGSRHDIFWMHSPKEGERDRWQERQDKIDAYKHGEPWYSHLYAVGGGGGQISLEGFKVVSETPNSITVKRTKEPKKHRRGRK
jgi:hypothetical protein